jgi:hypothetical protein
MNLIYVNGSASEDVYTLNIKLFDALKVTIFKIIATKQIIVKANITGELKDTLNLLVLLLNSNLHSY